jgi:hypothetical protein
MPKKIIIGFQVSEEFKKKVIEAGKKYKMEDGMSFPVNISMFCRIAVRALLNKIKKEERGK